MVDKSTVTHFVRQLDDRRTQPLFLVPQSAINFRQLVELLRKGPVTAFIGAGLSAPLQPTWSMLHNEMQRVAELQPPREFDVAFAPADFADFRDAMGSDRYLGVMRRRFGGVVTDYPDLYRIIDEIKGFEQLVTTNYDEFLASVAASNNRRPRIAVYPHFEDIGARYVYLHGRAETVESLSDLVLCEDDYGRAYEVPGRAKHMLQALFGRPGVFIGSSLQDPDLLVLLRQRMRLSGSLGLNGLPPLFAIVSVKSASEEEEDFSATAEVMTRRLHWLGVRAICYARDRSHSRLRSVLLQLQHEAEHRPVQAVFLKRARQLNKLGATATPEADDTDKVRDLIRGVPELARHFFERSASSPAWYDALKESVIIPGAVEPWERGDGARQIGPWAAAPYIGRIASQRPDAVTELIQKLEFTKNWHAQSTLARLAVKLPDDLLHQVLPVLATWMDEPDGDFSQISWELSELPDQLVRRGSSDLAFEIASELLKPTASGPTRGQRLRMHDHFLPQLLPAIKQLSKDRPAETYWLLKERLLDTLQLDLHGNSDKGWWRAAIEDHEQNATFMDTSLHFLLEEMREALLVWLDQSPDDASLELTELLLADVPLFTRLALFVCTARPEQIPQLRQPLITLARLHTYDLFHEMAVLVSQRFGDLDEASQELIHHLVREGFPRQPNETDSQWKQYRDSDRWHWLTLLPDEHWTEDERNWWEQLRLSQEPIEHPHFHVWHGPFEGKEFETEPLEGV